VTSRKALVRQWFEQAYNFGRTELADQLFAPNAKFNGQTEGPDGPKRRVAAYRIAFPDITAQIETILEEGDQVFIRWIATGTHQGNFNGIPATGKRVQTMICVEWRFQKQLQEQVVLEDWTVFDRLATLEQLGVFNNQ
jgi:steroid delta-isomerase-like uncharacterized protein